MKQSLPKFAPIFSLLILLANLSSARAESPARPDVLFVLVDDLRWDALGYMGHPFVKTPNIDRLRSQGAMMANAFVTTSICCPSRATFVTGTLANRHGVIDNETSEYNPEVTPPLTKYLQEAGYKTAMIGKWHMGNSGEPRPYFDYWLSFKGQGEYIDALFNINGKKVRQKGYTTDLLTDYAIDFIKKQPKGQPYFCMLSHKAVHEPFTPPARHQDIYGADRRIPEPVSWSEDFAGKPAWERRNLVREVRWDYRTRELEEEKLPASFPAQPMPDTKRYVDQLRCLSAVDESLGKIIEVLRERGTLENTLIVFTSDNGYFHMEHRRWDKRLAYEEGLRIPMLVVYPGRIKAGSTISQFVLNVDFAPTILNYAGLSVPSQMQGASMKPLFEEEKPKWRDAVFYEYWKELVHSIPAMTAVRTDRYKLISFPEINDIDELFDLQNDPHEMKNLAADPAYAQVHAEMRVRLEKARAENQWRQDVFPLNLPRVRGKQGVLLDLAVENGVLVDKAQSGLKPKLDHVEVREDYFHCKGTKASLKVSFDELTDPASWPFHIDVMVKPETDGVIAAQSTQDSGFKLFVQDGRPGVAVHAKTWIDTTTVIDGPKSILGKWTKLQVLIDYNRLVLIVDGAVAESVSLPLPFKNPPQTPLVIGGSSVNQVAEGLPDKPFAGDIQRFTLQRGLSRQ